jgi:hypothetical protein
MLGIGGISPSWFPELDIGTTQAFLIIAISHDQQAAYSLACER